MNAWTVVYLLGWAASLVGAMVHDKDPRHTVGADVWIAVLLLVWPVIFARALVEHLAETATRNGR